MGPTASSQRCADGPRDNAIELAESYAYSDSVFDTPLLPSIGQLIVVNPDPSMVVVALRQAGPPLRLAPGSFKRSPCSASSCNASSSSSPVHSLVPYAHFDIDGTDNIPKHGPAIIVMNHRSYFDAGVVSIAIARSGRAGALPRQDGGVRCSR